MQKPQQWQNCDKEIKDYVLGFVSLLRDNLGENLKGVYLHGSLAMNSFYPPKSDIDIIAVVFEKVSPLKSKDLNLKIALYNNRRPIYGYIEFSLILEDVALSTPSKIPYVLHYSSSCHKNILSDKIKYKGNLIDTDLSAHLMVVKQKGICLYGSNIETTFGDVKWEDFLFAVLDDLEWILKDENICESPYYATLNCCRVLQLLIDKNKNCLNKEEGGLWGLKNLPKEFHNLIRKALDTYQSNYYPKDEDDRRLGGMRWDNKELLRFRDYVKKMYEFYIK